MLNPDRNDKVVCVCKLHSLSQLQARGRNQSIGLLPAKTASQLGAFEGARASTCSKLLLCVFLSQEVCLSASVVRDSHNFSIWSEIKRLNSVLLKCSIGCKQRGNVWRGAQINAITCSTLAGEGCRLA